ncbi:hypothetical protein [Streptomyces sp.]|uniref:hypothetical protein n=1 Tax=Streptomyces sp. TaxID=1931 RepID=UPI0039C9F474
MASLSLREVELGPDGLADGHAVVHRPPGGQGLDALAATAWAAFVGYATRP